MAVAITTQPARDPVFRKRWDAARSRRLHDAADELMFALDALRHLIDRGYEDALDELINLGCGLTEDEPPRRPDVDPDRLAAGRKRLNAAGLEWAAAVQSKAALAQDLRDDLELAPVAS